MIRFLELLALLSSISPFAVSQNRSFTSTSIEILKERLICIGLNQYPIDRNHDGSDANQWNNTHFNITVQRILDINPSCVRINFYRQWFNPSGIISQYTWNSNEMQQVFKLFDWYKQQLPNTIIMN